MSARYSNDWDGECDMRADALELEHDRAREPYECDACFELLAECACPTLPLDDVYGMCTGCGSVEVRLNNVTGTRDLSSIGEHQAYPTGYGCEVCS